MKRVLLLSTLLAAGGAHAKPADGGPIDVKLGAGKFHEVCARLEAGAKRQYHWKASAPVDFNIHYHEGDKVAYPVRREAMRGDGGTFTAPATQDYCWMWTARNEPVQLSGQVFDK